jgi:hypothetical protein
MDLPYGKNHGGMLWGILWFVEKFGASWHNLRANLRGFILRNDYGAGLPPRLAKACARVGRNPEMGPPRRGPGMAGVNLGWSPNAAGYCRRRGLSQSMASRGDGK